MLTGLNPEYEVDRRDGGEEQAFNTPEFLKTWSLRFDVEGGNDFDGLSRLAGRVFLDGPRRFGFLANFDYFRESLPFGERDETVFSDYNFTYRFVQSGWILMHAGLGMRHQIDHGDDQFGFNFLYRGDLFPLRPFHIASELSVGNLNEALVLNGRLSVGANWRNLEVFAGYDFLRVGDANLQGPFLGLRCWF
jgi:hypothetical protein